MNKNILTDNQLKMKLVNYKFDFSSDEFGELKKLGFYHVFNSFVENNVRNNGQNKKLIDYLKLYKLDFDLRALLFPMILSLESIFKQRLNDTITEEIILNNSTSPHYNEVVKLCIKSKSNVNVKQTLFRSCSHKNQIVSHFFDNHNDIPIWAYFELLDLGQFLSIIENCTDKDDTPRGVDKIKEKFSLNCNFKRSDGGQFTQNQKSEYIYQSLRLIYLVRNNIAHNQPVIDGRYKNNGYDIKHGKLISMIADLLSTINPTYAIPPTLTYDFNTITDAVTIIYLLYVFTFGKDNISDRCKVFINDEIMLNNSSLNNKIHSKIFGLDNIDKANLMLSI